MEGTAGLKRLSSAVSSFFRMRLMIGWETLKFSARVYSVWLCRRYNRVAFSPWVMVSLWGLVLGLFQVMLAVGMFSMVANCSESSPVVRSEGNGFFLWV